MAQSVQNFQSVTVPLSVQAFNEVVNEDYEFYGKWVYDHLKYRQATVQPKDYLSSVFREDWKTRLDFERTTLLGKTIDQVGSGLLDFLPADFDQPVELLKTLQNQLVADAQGFSSFGQTWYYLRGKETVLLSDLTIPIESKYLMLSYCAMVRHYAKYQYETGLLQDSAAPSGVDGVSDRSGCLFGTKLSCILKAFGVGVLASLKSAVGAGGLAVFDSDTSTVFLTSFIKDLKGKGLIAGLFGFITALVNLGPECDCEFTPPAVSPCLKPLKINWIMTDCSDTHTAIIPGLPAGSFVSILWVVTNGVAIDFPGNANNPTTTQNILRVQQNSPNVPVSVGAVVTCSAGLITSIPSVDFNLIQMVKDPGTVIVNGATNAALNDTQTYTISGTCLANGNNTIQKGPNYAGVVVSSGLDFVRVRWTLKSNPPYNMGSVSAGSKNACNNSSSSGSISVNVY